MNHHDVRAIDDARKGVRNRILSTRPPRHDLDRLSAGEQRRRWRLGHFGWHRHDEVVDQLAIPERVDAPLENRSSTERQELLRLRGAEARATASGRDEGRNMQGAGTQSLILASKYTDHR